MPAATLAQKIWFIWYLSVSFTCIRPTRSAGKRCACGSVWALRLRHPPDALRSSCHRSAR
jgi:hypothetical protein